MVAGTPGDKGNVRVGRVVLGPQITAWSQVQHIRLGEKVAARLAPAFLTLRMVEAVVNKME